VRRLGLTPLRAIAALAPLIAAAGCGSGSKCNSPSTAGTSGAGTTCGARTGGAGTTGAAGATGGAGTTGSGGAAGTTGGGGAGGATDAAADHAPLAFEQQILDIAAAYTAWGRVDDELRWAPWLCRAPSPGIARASQSDDESTHGRKLYSVFAKNHAAYPDGPQDGQVVVKQSWVPELVPDADAGVPPNRFITDAGIEADHFYPYAKGPDGGIFQASKPAGLFIMFKLDPATPDTDEGWVYATVSPDGQVTAAGRVASCMGCHETSATHERLFGVPLSPLSP
jgi:hypothetical protein